MSALRRQLLSVALGLVAGAVVVALAADSEALVESVLGAPQLASDVDGALVEVDIHYRSDFYEQSFETLADLVEALPPDVTIRVVVSEQDEFDTLLERLEEAGVHGDGRLEALVTGFEISPWAKDRFGTLSRRGRSVIAVPPHRAAVGGARGNDEKVPDLLCGRLDHVSCRAMPFFFEGGDLIADDRHVYVAASMLERNAPLTEERREELLSQIEGEFGKPPIQIGKHGRDVPDHHIGMFLTPLGGAVVAVANPRLGAHLYRQLPPEEQVLIIDDDPVTLARFDRVARDLEAQGLTVVDVPLLLTDEARVYVSYNNAILEQRLGRGIVYMPVYGIESLDAAAADVFEGLGWRVEPIRVGKVYRQTGSLRCLVGVLARS